MREFTIACSATTYIVTNLGGLRTKIDIDRKETLSVNGKSKLTVYWPLERKMDANHLGRVGSAIQTGVTPLGPRITGGTHTHKKRCNRSNYKIRDSLDTPSRSTNAENEHKASNKHLNHNLRTIPLGGWKRVPSRTGHKLGRGEILETTSCTITYTGDGNGLFVNLLVYSGRHLQLLASRKYYKIRFKLKKKKKLVM